MAELCDLTGRGCVEAGIPPLTGKAKAPTEVEASAVGTPSGTRTLDPQIKSGRNSFVGSILALLLSLVTQAAFAAFWMVLPLASPRIGQRRWTRPAERALTSRDGLDRAETARQVEIMSASGDHVGQRSRTRPAEMVLASEGHHGGRSAAWPVRVVFVVMVYVTSSAIRSHGRAMCIRWLVMRNVEESQRGVRSGPKPWPIPDGWVQPIEEWSVVLVATSRSEQTIKTRVLHIRSLARGMDVLPHLVSREILTRWAGSKKWSTDTRNSHYASYRSFFRFVHADHPESDPTGLLAGAPRHPGLPRPAPDSVVVNAVASASARDALLVRAMAETGARVGEVVRIHRDDISLTQWGYSLLIHGKGGRQRVVPLPDHKLAKDLLASCAEGDGWAFPSPKGGHITSSWAGKVVSRALGEGWSSHPLRHRYGTKANRASGDIRAVQDLLGHARLTTTQVYTEVSSESRMRAAAGTVVDPQAAWAEVTALFQLSTGHTVGFDHTTSAVVFSLGNAPIDLRLSIADALQLADVLREEVHAAKKVSRVAVAKMGSGIEGKKK